VHPPQHLRLTPSTYSRLPRALREQSASSCTKIHRKLPSFQSVLSEVDALAGSVVQLIPRVTKLLAGEETALIVVVFLEPDAAHDRLYRPQ
jgi:hypothetical protein